MTPPDPDPPAARLDLLVNGERVAVPARISLDALVELVAATRQGVAVAVDGCVVPRSEWCDTILSGGARVEIVTAAAGG